MAIPVGLSVSTQKSMTLTDKIVTGAMSLGKWGLFACLGAVACFSGLRVSAQHPAIAQSEPPTAPSDQPSWSPPTGEWSPSPSRREDYGKIKVVWLQGTPYEMGYQHGTLLHDEIAEMGMESINSLNFLGRALGLSRLARRRSFPGVYEECQGLADATADIGMTVDGCMVLAFGDVYQAYFLRLLPDLLFNDGCAHFVATGSATADGGFYQGWTLDNNGGPIPYWADNPTILVRQPNDGIPHVFITVPAAIWPNAGFNAAGIVVSNNTAHPLSFDDVSLEGRSTVQLMAQVTQYASTYGEAYDIMASHERMRANLVMISDAKSDQAGVFELLGQEMGVRELDDNGLLYMTNHFASPEMVGRDATSESTFPRFQSFQQMLEPDGVRSFYGRINPQSAVKIMRDRTNPTTLQASSFDVADDDASIGGNGSQRQVVFDPLNLRFWMTTGDIEPIPESDFVCFSVAELLGLPSASSCTPAVIN